MMHGSLHSPDAYNFYKSINAGERFLSIVKNGLKLPRESPLPKFWYKNNASANADIVFLRAKVKDWLDGGYIVKVDSCPDHISPLTVDTRAWNGRSSPRPSSAFRHWITVIKLKDSQCLNARLSKAGKASGAESISRSTCYQDNRKICSSLKLLLFLRNFANRSVRVSADIPHSFDLIWLIFRLLVDSGKFSPQANSEIGLWRSEFSHRNYYKVSAKLGRKSALVISNILWSDRQLLMDLVNK